ncbi:MAG: rhomboid family intramembrane serine protease [Victivallales bacterium]|nr:rhomboid family intramembrane serine protease [Victivallales bacterium]
MSMDCPRCGEPLERSFYQGRISFHCPRGHGCAMTLSAVRALCGDTGFANMLWRRAAEMPSGLGGKCPVCHHPMTLVTLPVQGGILELDVCCRCQELWFDPNEIEALPKPPPPPQAPEMPQRARELLAMHEIERMAEENRSSAPPTGLGYVAGLLGFPVENGAPEIAERPWCTWIVTALCMLVFIATFGNRECISEWGLVPADCLRHNGATFITSMFLHAGIGHLIGNLYFFFIFGDNVEDVLGKPLFLALILTSGLAAALLHIAIFPTSTIPCIGASGFISGIIAAYAVFFPKVTIHLACRWGLMYRWLSIPAWGAFALWMLYQTVIGLLAMHIEAGIAFWAHVGGAIAGLAFGFALRRKVHLRLNEIGR